jgi:hypothetical protein
MSESDRSLIEASLRQADAPACYAQFLSQRRERGGCRELWLWVQRTLERGTAFPKRPPTEAETAVARREAMRSNAKNRGLAAGPSAAAKPVGDVAKSLRIVK